MLPTGCVLAQQTANGLYYKHLSTAGDGTQIPVGILRDARNTTPNGVSTNIMGNLVWSGALNASLISGTDTTSLVTGFGGGIGSGATGAWTGLLTKGRLMGGNATPAGGAFPGSPFDSSAKEIFS